MVNGETYGKTNEFLVSREQNDTIQQEQQRLKGGNSDEEVLMQVGTVGGGIFALITAFAIKGYKKIG